jgi:hypothetical protein
MHIHQHVRYNLLYFILYGMTHFWSSTFCPGSWHGILGSGKSLYSMICKDSATRSSLGSRKIWSNSISYSLFCSCYRFRSTLSTEFEKKKFIWHLWSSGKIRIWKVVPFNDLQGFCHQKFSWFKENWFKFNLIPLILLLLQIQIKLIHRIWKREIPLTFITKCILFLILTFRKIWS